MQKNMILMITEQQNTDHCSRLADSLHTSVKTAKGDKMWKVIKITFAVLIAILLFKICLIGILFLTAYFAD